MVTRCRGRRRRLWHEGSRRKTTRELCYARTRANNSAPLSQSTIASKTSSIRSTSAMSSRIRVSRSAVPAPNFLVAIRRTRSTRPSARPCSKPCRTPSRWTWSLNSFARSYISSSSVKDIIPARSVSGICHASAALATQECSGCGRQQGRQPVARLDLSATDQLLVGEAGVRKYAKRHESEPGFTTWRGFTMLGRGFCESRSLDTSVPGFTSPSHGELLSQEQRQGPTEEAADRFLNLVDGSGFWQSIDLRVCAVRCGRHWVNLVTRGFLDHRPVPSVPKFSSVNRSAVRAWQAVLSDCGAPERGTWNHQRCSEAGAVLGSIHRWVG